MFQSAGSREPDLYYESYRERWKACFNPQARESLIWDFSVQQAFLMRFNPQARESLIRPLAVSKGES